MNICITNVDSRPEYIGGIKRVSSALARQWVQMGHKVWFMSQCRSDLHLPEIDGTPQLFLPNVSDDAGEENTAYFTQFIRERKIDVVLHQHVEEHGITALCGKIRKCTSAKVVMAYHFAPTHKLDIVDSSFFPAVTLSNPIKHYVIDFLMNIRWKLLRRTQVKKELKCYFSNCLEGCDRMVLLSERFIPTMNYLTGYHFENKIRAINNPTIYTTDTIMPTKAKTVLWCGRVGYDAKRVDMMLSVWKRIGVKYPDWNCIIMGGGNIEYFKQIIRQQNIPNIQLLGFCDPEPYYKTGAILCMTSSAEGWGLVLVEGMAYGCVPIAYNSFASLPDIMANGENGFYVPAFDEDAYTQKLEMLMNDEALRLKMAKRGMSDIDRFNSGKIAMQWIELFNGLTCQ